MKLFNRSAQFHGFASQGFVYTNSNNWLSMDSTEGSGAFTDFGLNVTSRVTERLRMGAQVFDRNLGRLGQYHPSLDWAVADYHYQSWLSFRAGKVKTTLGLHNDDQDLDFLHTFALIPQSVYPTDLRDATIAHEGGDFYGTVSLPHKSGAVSYTAFGGHRSDSIYSGYPYLLSQFGTHFNFFGGLQYGGDLRWTTPVQGLLVGASRLDQDTTGNGNAVNPLNGLPVTYSERSRADWTNQFYGEYLVGRLRIDSEYRRYFRNQLIFSGTSQNITDIRGWYCAADYRVTKRFAFGGYYSRYTITSVFGGEIRAIATDQTETSLPANHVYDKVVTARINFGRHWNAKIEGHFMNGYGDGTYPDGFYPQLNPRGFKPNTNALVTRTGFNF